VTCGTWIGYDNRQSLGDKETGAKAALPMWMDFMKVAIADHPNEEFERPDAPKKELSVPVAAPAESAEPEPAAVQRPNEDNPPAPPDTEDEKRAPAQPVTPPSIQKEPLSLPYDAPHEDLAVRLDSVTNYPARTAKKSTQR
jgi:penicillin-binding protein 1A